MSEAIHNCQIEFIKSLGLPDDAVFVDAGANIGEYTDEVLKVVPNATVYCFEPNPNCAARLRDKAVTVHELALSDSHCFRTFYRDGDLDYTSSLHKRDSLPVEWHPIPHGTFASHVVSCHRLDEFFAPSQVIDLLKVDVEGHELSVFEGAGQLLHPDRIAVIEFEFNGCQIDSRTFFIDYWNLLTGAGYNMYYLEDDGSLQHIPTYDRALEDFQGDREVIAK